MKDEPAVGIALGVIIVMLLTSAGLAIGDKEAAAISVLATAAVPLLQGLLTRWRVYSPLSVERIKPTPYTHEEIGGA